MSEEKKDLAYDANEVPIAVGAIENTSSNHGLQRKLKVRSTLPLKLTCFVANASQPRHL